MIRIYAVLYMVLTILVSWGLFRYGVSNEAVSIYLDPNYVAFYIGGSGDKLFHLSLILHGVIFGMGVFYIFMLVPYFILLYGKAITNINNLLEMISSPFNYVLGFLFFSLLIVDGTIALSPLLYKENQYDYYHIGASLLLFLFTFWAVYKHNFISSLSYLLLRLVFRLKVSVINFEKVEK